MMADLITPLLDIETWKIIFSTSFFFGVFFFTLSIIGGFESHDHDIDGHDTHFDADGHDAHFDAGGHDAHLDAGGHDTHFDVNHDVHLDDHNLDGSKPVNIVIDDTDQIPEKQNEWETQSKHKLGSIASFAMFFGAIGLLNASDLSDVNLGFALLAGVIASKVFNFLIGTIAKNTNNPIYRIGYGDPAKVLFGISYKKTGMINVTRKDGIIVSVLGRGATPADEFQKGETGIIVGRDEDGYYLVSK